MRYLRLLLIGLVSLVTIIEVRAQSPYGTDLQVWNDTQIIIPLNKKKDVNAVIWMFGRLGNDVRMVTDARIGGLLTKKLNKYVTIGGGYLYRYSNATFRRSRYESRYLGFATFSVPLTENKKWTLVNRNLLQYEDRYSRPNATVLRNRAWLKREVTIGSKKIEPFVSFETFYDFQLKDFSRFRTQVGLTRKVNARFSMDIYYVRQDETGNGTRPGTLNGIGSSFRINL